jgi:hypothetical protein
MRNFRTITSILLLGMLVVIALPNAKAADTANRLTEITFSVPVEIAGIVLAPGSYEFRYLDHINVPNVVLVFNSKNDLVATLMANPVYRVNTTDHSEMTFEDRGPSAPKAIKDWYYPNDNYGVEFVYPRTSSARMARGK